MDPLSKSITTTDNIQHTGIILEPTAGEAAARLTTQPKPLREQYLTLRDVAQRFQCSRSTVWRLINDRGLRVVRSGGLVRVSERALQYWIDRNSTTDGAEGGGQQ